MDKANILVIVVLLAAVIARDFYNISWKTAPSSSSISPLHQHESDDVHKAEDKRKERPPSPPIIIDTGPNSPGSRISKGMLNGPIVKFLYCTSSGYYNSFQQFKDFIQEHHPELTVEGYNYPPTPFRKAGAQIFSVLKFLVIGSILLSSYSFFNILRLPPGLIQWMNENKTYAALMTFFLCNFIETQLVSTGAFEIYFNDVPIWSKLQTGRLPSPSELEQMLQNQIKMGGAGPAGSSLLLERFDTAF